MALRVTGSASRHGISQERATYVIDHCPLPLYPTEAAGLAARVMFLGPRKYERAYWEVMLWHDR